MGRFTTFRGPVIFGGRYFQDLLAAKIVLRYFREAATFRESLLWSS